MLNCLSCVFLYFFWPCFSSIDVFVCFRFGPRESKKAMMYSDSGRLNCNVSYTTFATPVRGQVRAVRIYNISLLLQCPVLLLFICMYLMSSSSMCQGSDHKEFSSILHKALEGAIILDSFPKTTVDVFALVLESGGGKP